MTCRHCGLPIHYDGERWVHAASLRVPCLDGRADAEPRGEHST